MNGAVMLSEAKHLHLSSSKQATAEIPYPAASIGT
jgi:hypothetical protein